MFAIADSCDRLSIGEEEKLSGLDVFRMTRAGRSSLYFIQVCTLSVLLSVEMAVIELLWGFDRLDRNPLVLGLSLKSLSFLLQWINPKGLNSRILVKNLALTLLVNCM